MPDEMTYRARLNSKAGIPVEVLSERRLDPRACKPKHAQYSTLDKISFAHKTLDVDNRFTFDEKGVGLGPPRGVGGLGLQTHSTR
jgi:hypothetical protein